MDANQTPPVVETASGTTSPTNQDSGHLAYVIVALVLALGMFATQRFFSSLGSAVEVLGAEYVGMDLDFLDELTDVDDLETPSDYGTGKLAEKDVEVLGLTEALEYDIAPWSLTLDSQIDATEYSGVPADVTAAVRALVRADADASARVVRCLRAAGREGEDPDAKLSEAIEVCDEQVEALGAKDETGIAGMGDARDACLCRWQAIRSELALIATGEATFDELDTADRAVWDATTTAAKACTQVLADASR